MCQIGFLEKSEAVSPLIGPSILHCYVFGREVRCLSYLLVPEKHFSVAEVDFLVSVSTASPLLSDIGWVYKCRGQRRVANSRLVTI